MFLAYNIMVGVTASSGERAPSGSDFISIGIYTLMVAGLISLLMLLAALLGQDKPNANKALPYESGIVPTGPARLRLPVQFYLVAIFFIIFDLEAVFVYSWAVAFDILGWPGYADITFFTLTLFAGLVYVWKKKGLEWGPKQK